MQFPQTFQLYDFFDTLVSLFMAFVFGALIGAKRRYRQRSAGLRTNVLVSVGAAAFVDLANHLGGADGSVRVIAYVVSGIGFLGAGAIMKEGINVRGLNAPATLWASAAVGSCAGTDMVAQSAALTLFVLDGVSFTPTPRKSWQSFRGAGYQWSFASLETGTPSRSRSAPCNTSFSACVKPPAR
jgi:putative Mg2+ transporter-C (MgtC) family protein